MVRAVRLQRLLYRITLAVVRRVIVGRYRVVSKIHGHVDFGLGYSLKLRRYKYHGYIFAVVEKHTTKADWLQSAPYRRTRYKGRVSLDVEKCKSRSVQLSTGT